MKTKHYLLAALSLIVAGAIASPSLSAGKSPEKRITRIIKRADANGDQRISRQELAAQMARTFKTLDVNKDNGLSLAELQGQRAVIKAANRQIRTTHVNDFATHRVMGMPKAVVRHFDQLDANKNGVLTGDELAGIVEKMFKRADKNNDNYLSSADFSA